MTTEYPSFDDWYNSLHDLQRASMEYLVKKIGEPPARVHCVLYVLHHLYHQPELIEKASALLHHVASVHQLRLEHPDPLLENPEERPPDVWYDQEVEDLSTRIHVNDSYLVDFLYGDQPLEQLTPTAKANLRQNLCHLACCPHAKYDHVSFYCPNKVLFTCGLRCGAPRCSESCLAASLHCCPEHVKHCQQPGCRWTVLDEPHNRCVTCQQLFCHFCVVPTLNQRAESGNPLNILQRRCQACQEKLVGQTPRRLTGKKRKASSETSTPSSPGSCFSPAGHQQLTFREQKEATRRAEEEQRRLTEMLGHLQQHCQTATKRLKTFVEEKQILQWVKEFQPQAPEPEVSTLRAEKEKLWHTAMEACRQLKQASALKKEKEAEVEEQRKTQIFQDKQVAQCEHKKDLLAESIKETEMEIETARQLLAKYEKLKEDYAAEQVGVQQKLAKLLEDREAYDNKMDAVEQTHSEADARQQQLLEQVHNLWFQLDRLSQQEKAQADSFSDCIDSQVQRFVLEVGGKITTLCEDVKRDMDAVESRLPPIDQGTTADSPFLFEEEEEVSFNCV